MSAPIIYIPHGGGPMPLFNEPNHHRLIQFLKNIRNDLGKPKAILVISAHWEEDVATVSSAAFPELIYDYYGFPEESYQVDYSAPGEPKLAREVVDMLRQNGIEAREDENRGFDHGTFVPLKLLFPNADIPVIQLSLTNDLDPQKQIDSGKAIFELSHQNILILGSGLSFHNLQVLMSKDPDVYKKSEKFDNWLNQVVVDHDLNEKQKESALVNWKNAEEARFSHPREEHLLPLHVCFGAALKAGKKAVNIFNETFLGTKVSGFLWQ